MMKNDLLHNNWAPKFKRFISETNDELFLSSPYIKKEGVNFLLKNLPKRFLEKGSITVLSNLSANNLMQNSTDVAAISLFKDNVPNFSLWHLPNLHAKVYVSDKKEAIITSGNLTAGGLFNNYEYGVRIFDKKQVGYIFSDINFYAQLGSQINDISLIELIKLQNELKSTIAEENKHISKMNKEKIDTINSVIDKKLIEPRVNKESANQIFSNTILYLLKRMSPLTTQEIHNEIQKIHPDICDDSIHRIIDRSYGPLWKHYVRKAEQHLKQKGLIVYNRKLWALEK